MSGSFTPPPGWGATTAEAFGASWLQGSGLARGFADGVERMRRFDGELSPRPVEGYSPFTDEAIRPFLIANTGTLGAFARSRSPEESQHILQQQASVLARDAYNAGAGLGFGLELVAGLLSPENIVTAPIGAGASALTAASRLGRAAQAGRNAALVNAGLTQAEISLGLQNDLPENIRPGAAEQVAFSAIFGAVLGGAAGALSRQQLDAHVAGHARTHDELDGMRTPGVIAAERSRWDVANQRKRAGEAPPPKLRDDPPEDPGPPGDDPGLSRAAPTAWRDMGEMSDLPPAPKDGDLPPLREEGDAPPPPARAEGDAAPEDRGEAQVAPELPSLPRAVEADTIRLAERLAGDATEAPPAPAENGALPAGGTPTGPPEAASAAAAPPAPPPKPRPGAARLAFMLGMDKVFARTGFSWYRGMTNGFDAELGDAIARWFTGIAEIPGLRLKGNAGGELATDTAPVEAMGKAWMHEFRVGLDHQNAQYYEYRNFDPTNATIGRVKGREMVDMAAGVLRRSDGQLTQAEFDERVFVAIAHGSDDHPAPIPQVERAAAIWRDIYAKFEEEGARHGILLTARHKDLARAALQREADGREARIQHALAQLDRLGNQPQGWAAKWWTSVEAVDGAEAKVIGLQRRLDYETGRMIAGLNHEDLAAIQAGLDKAQDRLGAAMTKRDALWAAAEKGPMLDHWRDYAEGLRASQKDLDDRLRSLDEVLPEREAYVRHRWRAEVVREQRDRLHGIVVDDWRAAGDKDLTWADMDTRADIAIGRVAGDSIADIVERVIERAYRRQMLPDQAAKAAKITAGDVRQVVEEMAPGRLGIEIRSLIGMNKHVEAPGDLPNLIAKALGEAGVPTLEPMRLIRELARAADYGAAEGWGDAARPGMAKERTIDVRTAAVKDFLDLDHRSAAQDYTRRMGNGIEMARKFGDASMLSRIETADLAMLREIGRKGDAERAALLEERQAVLQAARDTRDHVLGTYGVPEDPTAIGVRITRGLINAAVLTQMGKAVFANLTDVGRGVMATGLTRAFPQFLNLLTGGGEAFRLAGRDLQLAGAMLDLHTLGRAQSFGELAGDGAGTRFEKGLHSAAQQMNYLNLVGWWTNQAQRFFGGIIQSEMIESAVRIRDGKAGPEELTRMAAWGFDAARAARIADSWEAAGGGQIRGLHLPATEGWADKDLAREFRASVMTALDSAVIRPGAADRPGWLSSPLMRMLTLYKGFGLAASQRLVLAGVQQRDARVLTGIASSVLIAYLVAGPSKGDNDKNPVLSGERLFTAIDRSGALGLLSDFNTTLETGSGNEMGLRPLLGMDPPLYAKDPHWAQRAGAVAGPAVSPWLNAAWALTAHDAKADARAGAIRRLLPFQNTIWLSGLFRAAAKETATAIGDPEKGGRSATPMPGFMGGSVR